MKDVHDRAVPYYKEYILPELKRGENVLVVGHGNTFRALVKYLEGMSDEGVSDLEFGTGRSIFMKSTKRETSSAKRSGREIRIWVKFDSSGLTHHLLTCASKHMRSLAKKL